MFAFRLGAAAVDGMTAEARQIDVILRERHRPRRMPEDTVHIAVDRDDVAVEVAEPALRMSHRLMQRGLQEYAGLMVVEAAWHLAVDDLVAIQLLLRAAFDDDDVGTGIILEELEGDVEARRMTFAAHHEYETVLAGAGVHATLIT